VSAPALRDAQASFWRALHAGEADPALTALVLPTPTLVPAARIEIYQDMYFWRLYEVLREDFPKTHEALGDDFEHLVRSYLARHPSSHPSVRHLGAHLAAFLETDALARSRPWLPDLARLERARVDAFDAPDAVPVRANDLCAVSPGAWAELRFTTIPAVEVIRSRWPVHEVWAAPQAPPSGPRATSVRVWRQEFTVFHAVMDEVEDAAFTALRAGEPFGAVCEAVGEHAPDTAAADAGGLLARWLEDGLIARFG
jgi:hypothetical protein